MSAAVARKARACERGDSVVLAVARASPRLVRARAVCVRRAAWAGRGRITPCATHPRRHPTLRARGRGKGNCPSRRTGPLVTLDCRCHSSIRTPWAPAATRGRTTPHVVHHLDLAIIHCRRAGNLLTPQSGSNFQAIVCRGCHAPGVARTRRPGPSRDSEPRPACSSLRLAGRD